MFPRYENTRLLPVSRDKDVSRPKTRAIPPSEAKSTRRTEQGPGRFAADLAPSGGRLGTDYRGPVTGTPWGAAASLRERRLSPGRGQSSEANARNQRERLFGALVAVVSEKGYEQTTVADMVELSGVSRSAFYRHFADKRECFVAAYDELARGTLAELSAALAGDRPPAERLGSAFARLAELIVLNRPAARICLVDLYAAGTVAIEHTNRANIEFERLLRDTLDESPSHAGLPPAVTRAILGGVYKVVHSRVRRGGDEELRDLAPSLTRWALSYQAPPGPLRKPRTAPSRPRGGPQFAIYGDAGRIFEALAIEISDHGYQATTIDGIAAQAGASTHTFYKHFASKRAALLSAFDAALTQSYGLARPAFDHAPDWPHGVRAVLHVLLSFLAGNPAWARTAVVESLGAGPEGMARSDAALDRLARFLEPGLELGGELDEIATEAAAGAIHTLVYDQIRRSGPARLLEALPACAFVGLAPFIGAGPALAVANDGGRRSGWRERSGLD